MRSILAHLKRLVLPGGAGPTSNKIIITGNPPSIQIYLAGVLVGEWDPNSLDIINPTNGARIFLDPVTFGVPTIRFDPPDSPGIGDYFPGSIIGDYVNLEETPFLSVFSPKTVVPAGTNARITLFGSNPGLGDPPRITLSPNDGGGVGGFVDVITNSDFRVAGISIGRGNAKPSQVLDTDSAGFIADGPTDMFLNNVPVVAGREYEVTLHTKWGISAAGQWSIGCHINGTRIGEFDIITEAAAGLGMTHGACLWHPTVTRATDDVTVELDEFGGASTLTFQAAGGDATRYLSVRDTGV